MTITTGDCRLMISVADRQSEIPLNNLESTIRESPIRNLQSPIEDYSAAPAAFMTRRNGWTISEATDPTGHRRTEQNVIGATDLTGLVELNRTPAEPRISRSRRTEPSVIGSHGSHGLLEL